MKTTTKFKLTGLAVLLMASMIRTEAAHAQVPEGDWTLHLNSEEYEWDVEFQTEFNDSQFTLRLADEEQNLALEKIELTDESLRFDIVTNHGSIVCALYKEQEDVLTGVCDAPMGEFVAEMLWHHVDAKVE